MSVFCVTVDTPSGYKSSAQVVNLKPTINVSRQQYDAALASWRAQRAAEYEIEVDYEPELYGGKLGSMTMNVRDASSISILQTPVHLTQAHPDPVNFTVEKLFAHVDDVLNNGLGAMTGDWAYQVEYKIEFDPVLGYPEHIARIGSAPPHWKAAGLSSSTVRDSSYSITVRSLKILTHQPTPTPPPITP
jgi:hypothetical protein